MKESTLTIHGQKFTYKDFLHYLEKLVKSIRTSGEKQSQALVAFTVLNYKRMQRIDKTLKLREEIKDVLLNIQPQYWVVITEAWCGDSAQTLPVLAGIAQASNGKIRLNIILRDENPQWIERYHTNGSKSIPKLVAFDEEGEELFMWGPRPAEAQELLLAWKSSPAGRSWDDFEKELHTWYARDKTSSSQEELAALLKKTIHAQHDVEQIIA